MRSKDYKVLNNRLSRLFVLYRMLGKRQTEIWAYVTSGKRVIFITNVEFYIVPSQFSRIARLHRFCHHRAFPVISTFSRYDGSENFPSLKIITGDQRSVGEKVIQQNLPFIVT